MASDYEAMSHESEGVCWCGTDHRPATGSERIAEVLAAHALWGEILVCECERWHWDAEVDNDPYSGHAKHQAEQLAAAGIGHVPTALHQAADVLETDGVGFFDGGCGSNPIDQAKLEGISQSLAWLRARADRAGGTA